MGVRMQGTSPRQGRSDEHLASFCLHTVAVQQNRQLHDMTHCAAVCILSGDRSICSVRWAYSSFAAIDNMKH